MEFLTTRKLCKVSLRQLDLLLVRGSFLVKRESSLETCIVALQLEISNSIQFSPPTPIPSPELTAGASKILQSDLNAGGH